MGGVWDWIGICGGKFFIGFDMVGGVIDRFGWFWEGLG